MNSASQTQPAFDTPPPSGAPEDLCALTRQRIAELDRLRKIGLAKAERLSVLWDGLSPEQEIRLLIRGTGVMRELDRVTRAVRQIVVLEYELRGLFKAPDRNALRPLRLVNRDCAGIMDKPETEPNDLVERNDLDDLKDARTRTHYSRAPMDEVVADIREALGAEPPPHDPFAPHAGRKAAERAPREAPSEPIESPPSAGTAPPRPKPAAKPKPAATPARRALPRPGFRTSPTSPHNPGTPSGRRKRRRNRGPPG